MGMIEGRRMTGAEKLVVHLVFGIGLVLLLAARILYLREAAGKHGVNCPKPCCAVTNGVVKAASTNVNPFVKGLAEGFKKGLGEGLDKK